MSESLLINGHSKVRKNRISIILADDHPLLRRALRNILETQADFHVIAEAGDGEEAISLAEEVKHLKC